MRCASSAATRFAGQQHFHRVLARDVARQRHHRRRAEQADVDARRRELAPPTRRPPDRSSRQAGSPPPSRRLDGGDHRLRQRDDRLHHRAAIVHHALERRAAAIGAARAAVSLLEIVSGAECRPVGGDHDGAHAAVRGDRGEFVGKRGDQGFRQAVALLRPVQRQHAQSVRSARAAAPGRLRACVLLSWCADAVSGIPVGSQLCACTRP